MQKILIPIQGDYVAQRFDLAVEIVVVLVKDAVILDSPRTIIMEKPSDEELCQMIISESITDLVCGGIDEAHYSFLVWKKVRVFDGVISDWKTALDHLVVGNLEANHNYLPKQHSFSL